jgi:hypothetical protein
MERSDLSRRLCDSPPRSEPLDPGVKRSRRAAFLPEDRCSSSAAVGVLRFSPFIALVQFFGRWFLHCEHHVPTFVCISPANESVLRAAAGLPRPT